MKAWAIALVALIVGAGAVIASLLAVQPDRTSDDRVSSGGAFEPSFTVIDDAPKASASASPSAEPQLVPIGLPDDEPAPAAVPTRRPGRSRINVQSGEVEEASTDQELEEEEAEQEAEESEARAKAREERREQDD